MDKEGKGGQYDLSAYVSLTDQRITRQGSFVEGLYKKEIPRLLDSLTRTHAAEEIKSHFVSRILGVDFSQRSPQSKRNFFQRLDNTLQNFQAGEPLSWNQASIELLIDSVETRPDYNEEYFQRVTRTVSSYINGKERPIPQVDTIVDAKKAIDLTEKESMAIGARILSMIKEANEKIAISPRTVTVTVQKDGKEEEISSEFFQDEASRKGVEYARIGNLFFVDASYKDRLPQEIQHFTETNVIFINNMVSSEFSGRLGYFTANTLASLMSSNVAGSVVLDCGTGSGALALASKRLGAKAVIGVDNSEDRVEEAQKNAEVNGYRGDTQVTFIQADLRDREEITSHTSTQELGSPVVILSNIGSWGNYDITNITSYSYIPVLRDLGFTISEVVSGGYNPGLETKDVPYETTFLQQQGIQIQANPYDVEGYDRDVLQALGFTKQSEAESEPLEEPGSFIRIARSQLVKAA